MNLSDMSYKTETVTKTVTKTVKTITKTITETEIVTTSKDDYETLEETYQVQRCFKVEKDDVNKDPYNILKHSEPQEANDDDKYYAVANDATEFEEEDAEYPLRRAHYQQVSLWYHFRHWSPQ